MQQFRCAPLLRCSRLCWSALAFLSFALLLLLVGFMFAHVGHAAGSVTWYVAPTGNDGNDCLSAITACKTVGGAVAKAGGEDRVIVATGVYAEHLILDKSLTITGAGADATILDGVRTGTVISITNTITSTTAVTITGMTIRNGQPRGIMNIGALNLISSRVSGNTGPGIVNSFTMTLTNVLVSNNTGGGIGNFRIATLERTTINNNTGGFGGGIYNTGAITLTNVTISGNSASRGGAIYTEGPAPLTATTFRHSSTRSNDSPGYFLRSVRLSNVTISGNSASQIGGIFSNPFALVSLHNTIVANNTNGNCTRGPVVSGGYNLSSDDTCDPTGPGDRSNVDPRLGSLQDNGGPTPTHGLAPDSPAIDSGDPAACPPTDQRGIGRPIDGNRDGVPRCDSGAYELNPAFVFLPILRK